MEVKVNVTLDLGTATVALLNGLVKGVSAPVMPSSPEAKAPAKEVVKEQAKTEEKPAVSAPAKSAAPAPKPAAKPAAKPSFADMDDDDKLEAIKAEVTRNVKNKKGSDIKFMLAQFDASRASDLSPESYDAFYDAIQRYGKGESVTDIFPADENLA